MKVKNLLIGLTAALPMFVVAPASANDAADACDVLIKGVQAQLKDTYIEENVRKKNGSIKEGLNDKLDNASYKLIVEAKYPDSMQKLEDFVYTLEQLAMPKKKKGELIYMIDPDNAAKAAGEMAEGANGAIECISWL